MSRDARLYLQDIATACEKVQRYVAGMTLESFRADGRTYDAVVARSNPTVRARAAERGNTAPLAQRQALSQTRAHRKHLEASEGRDSDLILSSQAL